MILFYQKNLFENPIYKRIYYKQFRETLRPPQTFSGSTSVIGVGSLRVYRFPNHPLPKRKFLNILGMAVKNAYSSVATPEEAMNLAQEQLSAHFQTRF